MSVLVVGMDFSASSDLALRRAILLARESGSELHLVHVLESSPSKSVSKGADDPGELLAALRRSIVDGEGVPCRTEIRSGDVAQELVAAATEDAAASIVIGPHERALLRDWLRGSTAERIVSHAKAPLIVVNGNPVEPWRRCLVPVDFGPAARRAADAVSNIPFLSKSLVVFAHIYDAEAREMMGRAFVQGTEREDYLREEAHAAQAKLRNFVDELCRGEAKLVVRENGGSVARRLDDISRDEGTDLIIVSSSNKGLVEQAIIGSVTEDLLRHGTTDIMVIPSSGEAHPAP